MKNDEILFCYTVVKKFKRPFIKDAYFEFIDDIKHLGISQEKLQDLEHEKRQVSWETESDHEQVWVAVEIVSK